MTLEECENYYETTGETMYEGYMDKQCVMEGHYNGAWSFTVIKEDYKDIEDLEFKIIWYRW